MGSEKRSATQLLIQAIIEVVNDQQDRTFVGTTRQLWLRVKPHVQMLQKQDQEEMSGWGKKYHRDDLPWMGSGSGATEAFRTALGGPMVEVGLLAEGYHLELNPDADRVRVFHQPSTPEAATGKA